MRIKSLITAAITAAVAVPAMANGRAYTQTRESTVTTYTVQQFPAPTYYVNPRSRTYQQDMARAKAFEAQAAQVERAAQQAYRLQNRTTTTTITTVRKAFPRRIAPARRTIIQVRPVVPAPAPACGTIVYNAPVYNSPPVYSHICIPAQPTRIYQYRDRDDFRRGIGNRYGHERYGHQQYGHERFGRDRHDWGRHEEHRDFGSGFHFEIHIGSR